MIKVNDIVIIKKYIGDQYNEHGRIVAIQGKNVWVSNLNQPFMGTVSDTFNINELKEIKKDK